MKRKSKLESKKPSVPENEATSALATVQESVTSPARRTVYITCERHPDTEFRVGGFCEKCYGEDSVERMASIDEALQRKIIDNLDALIGKVIDTNDPVLIERFLGRILTRFNRPSESKVSGTLKGIMLHAPVDFGRKG